MKTSKLNERSRWLLLYVAHQPMIETPDGPQQRGMASQSRVPTTAPPGVCLGTMRGLEKRGYVEERHTGCFYITDAGKKRAEEESLLHGGALAFALGAEVLKLQARQVRAWRATELPVYRACRVADHAFEAQRYW